VQAVLFFRRNFGSDAAFGTGDIQFEYEPDVGYCIGACSAKVEWRLVGWT